MIRNKAQELLEEYEKNLKELQSSCRHINMTDFMDFIVYPGRLASYKVMMCKNCNFLMSFKYYCRDCGKETVAWESPENHYLCSKCLY